VTISEAIRSATEALATAGVAEPRREAASLLMFVLNEERAYLAAHPDERLTAEYGATYLDAVQRRCRREPFQYIVGKQEFYGLEFAVGPGVLIPRPETELLVEAAIEVLTGYEQPRFLDIGTGSGCIAVSILKHVPEAVAVAVDISGAAIEIAKANAVRHAVDHRIEFVPSDLFANVRGRFPLIVSNPPYVPQRDSATIQAEVRDHEPPVALFGGPDGLSVIRRLVFESPAHVQPRGWLMIEIGFDQADTVGEMFDKSTWSSVSFKKDLQGIPRALIARLSDISGG
jgi:release factor glutamine methyltransferase